MINYKDEVFKKKPEESFNEYCLRISALKETIEDVTWTTVARIIQENTKKEYSADKYRKMFNKNKLLSNKKETENNTVDYNSFKNSTDNKEVISTNYERGETISTKEIPLTERQINNPDELLKAHGFDSDKFQIKTATNIKTTRTTTNGKNYYYSSRITVKPKEFKEVSFEDIDNYFNNFNNKKFNSLKIFPKQYDPDGEFLEIDLQDIHMGLLSYGAETGEDYDVDIAKERLRHCISDVYQRCQGKKFKRIVLVLLGDILHIDNLDGTTTKGTRQDVDTRPTRIFDEALNVLIEVIESLGQIAPVEVINLQGNHDRFASYCLCKSLEMAFREENKVTFLNSPNPRKWKRYGQVLIGYAHGDMKPNAVSEWLSNECEDWSKAKYREVHLGHLHSLQTLQKIENNQYGLIVRYLPALCASSAWEHEMGFPKSQRGLMSFVWNENKGLREIWYSNI